LRRFKGGGRSRGRAVGAVSASHCQAAALPPGHRCQACQSHFFDGIGVSDLTMVLDLANRLRLDGHEKATDLAKHLLDAMLEVPKK
jgi:hypothetical protein